MNTEDQMLIVVLQEMRGEVHNWAENLLNLAHNVLLPRGRLVMSGEPEGHEIGCARAVTALKFWSMPKSFQLRAQVEEWDIQTIIREMY